MFYSFDFYVKFGVLEEVAVSLNQAHVGDFLSEIGGYISEVSGQAQSDSPRLVFGGLDDQRHDEGLVFVFGQYFRDLFERFGGQNSDLVLLIG